MGFRSNEELGNRLIGDRWKLTAPLVVPKGEFTSGSILKITEEPDEWGEYTFIDEDSKETVSFNPIMVACEPYTPTLEDLRQI